MKTELIYDSSLPFRVSPQTINIIEKNNKRTIIFYNEEQQKLAKKSIVFLEDFFDFYHSSRIDRSKIKIFGKKFNIRGFFDIPLLKYLSQCPHPEKKEIVSSLVRLSDKYSNIELANKFSVFLINLKKLSKSYASDKLHRSVIPTLKSLHTNTIPREPHIIEFNKKCNETYDGFVRAIRSGTITTAKVTMPDGTVRRMFFKSQVGSPENNILTKRENKELRSQKMNLGKGYLELAIDPLTLEIYAIKTKNGIHFGTPAEIEKPFWMSKDKERFLKKLVKTELERHLDEVYAKRKLMKGKKTKGKGKVVVPGIKRMKETYRRMSSKPRWFYVSPSLPVLFLWVFMLNCGYFLTRQAYNEFDLI